MRRTFWYIVGGQLATISIPALAQDAAEVPPAEALPDGVGQGELTPDQMAAYDGWPAEQKAVYDNWPTDTQAYFWTLTPDRQSLFFRLAENDRLALTAMSDPDRDAAWQMVEEKAAAQDATPPAGEAPMPEPPAEDYEEPDTGMDDPAEEVESDPPPMR